MWQVQILLVLIPGQEGLPSADLEEGQLLPQPKLPVDTQVR